MTYEGSCECGAVRYHAEGPMRPVIACHCTQCRKTTGNYVTATGAAREAVAIIGEVRWYQSSEMARRGFCPECGSQLFWDGPGSHLSIMAGTLDDDTGLTLAGHIFCADKGSYYEIADGLPQATQDDPGMTTMVIS
ncbi:MAG: GFA family protein [Pseudomonadota bacterium]